MPKLLTHRLTEKQLSEDINQPGDFCIRECVQIIGQNGKSNEILSRAIILKCPFCKMDMMSTSVHKIFYRRTFWQELLFLPGRGKLNIKNMLQCPYNPAHKFLIKNGKIKKA